MTAAHTATNFANAKNPPHKKRCSVALTGRDRIFRNDSLTYYEQWNHQSTVQYKMAYTKWKEKHQLAQKRPAAKQSRTKTSKTTISSSTAKGSKSNALGGVKQNGKAQKVKATKKSSQKSDHELLELIHNSGDAATTVLPGAPSTMNEIPVDTKETEFVDNEKFLGVVDKTEARAVTFAGQRRRKRDMLERLSAELTIPPSQYWAIVEGVITVPGTADRTVFLEQTMLEGRTENLPKEGRVLELMPHEAMPGKWTLDMQSNVNNHRLDDDFDILREDWSSKRLVVRHASHQHVQNISSASLDGYSKATVDPSHHRITTLMSQGVYLDDNSVSMVFTLSLIAFDGFSSAHECRLSALPLGCKTLKSLNWIRGLPPKVIPIPQFETEIEGAFASQAYKIETAGGIGLLGCFVDDVAKAMTDYRIDVFCHDASNQVVGLDVTFQNSRTVNPIASDSTSLGSTTKRPRHAALTSVNLECHLMSLQQRSAESLSEPITQQSDSFIENSDKISPKLENASEENDSNRCPLKSSSNPASLEGLEQRSSSCPTNQPIKAARDKSIHDETTIQSHKRKDTGKECFSQEDCGDTNFWNLGPTAERPSVGERENDSPEDKENVSPTWDAKAKLSYGGKQKLKPNRVSLEPLPNNFSTGPLPTSSTEKDKNERSRYAFIKLQEGNALRMITPSINAPNLNSLAPKSDYLLHKEKQVERKVSPTIVGLHSVVKPTKLDYDTEYSFFSSKSHPLLPGTDGMQDSPEQSGGLLTADVVHHDTETGEPEFQFTETEDLALPSTWRAFLPSFHNVFYGVHDEDDHVETTADMLSTYEPPNPPHSTLDGWLLRLGTFLFPDDDDEQVGTILREEPFCTQGWLLFQACCHDVFFGVHDELHYIEMPSEELPTVVMTPLSSEKHACVYWCDDLWDDTPASIDDMKFLISNWLLAIVCLFAFVPLFQYAAEYFLSFDLPHLNSSNDCDPKIVGYWSSFPCEYLPAYLASYFIKYQSS
ncbi:hypothetical protein FisN_6Lh427 [Fistulifera solaris]|uniref:Uncharacterized protein n=1 Tax=Fistulifera solaris TaxID=1519565 RepID=A0A1Z5JKU6_FISSO|nr:hypothetical protein FisN_6Lh427 [Fistulifera solaris]|eukprot:GAX14643.1 hypothetical protein FisN_6Lh427 [Fistulifera solaris]